MKRNAVFLFATLLAGGCASVQKQDIVNHVDARARPIPWVNNIPMRVAGEAWFDFPEANPGDCVLMIVWVGNDGEEHPLGMGVWSGPGYETMGSVEYGRYNFAVTRIPQETEETDENRKPIVMFVGWGDVYMLAYKVRDSACDRSYYTDQE